MLAVFNQGQPLLMISAGWQGASPSGGRGSLASRSDAILISQLEHLVQTWTIEGPDSRSWLAEALGPLSGLERWPDNPQLQQGEAGQREIL